MRHQRQRPRAVVVGCQLRIGIHLLTQQRLRQRPVGLVRLHNQRSRRIVSVAQLHHALRPPHFNSLHAQNVDHERHPRRVFLIRRQDEPVRRLLRSRRHRFAALHIEVAERAPAETPRQIRARSARPSPRSWCCRASTTARADTAGSDGTTPAWSCLPNIPPPPWIAGFDS